MRAWQCIYTTDWDSLRRHLDLKVTTEYSSVCNVAYRDTGILLSCHGPIELHYRE